MCYYLCYFQKRQPKCHSGIIRSLFEVSTFLYLQKITNLLESVCKEYQNGQYMKNQ